MNHRAYTKMLLQDGPQGEISLVRWADGVWSSPHDHGGAAGHVTVLEGAFEERCFTRAEDQLVLIDVRRWTVGDVIPITPDGVHAMRAGNGGVTLHVYGPQTRPEREFP